MVVFTLMMLPSMSALEIHAVEEANKAALTEKIETIKGKVESEHIGKIIQSLFLNDLINCLKYFKGFGLAPKRFIVVK